MFKVSKIKSTLVFRDPPPSEAVIFFENQNKILERLILEDFSSQTLDIRVKLYLNIKIIFSTVINFFRSLSIGDYKALSFRRIFREFYISYYQTVINIINPRFVITAVDDSSIFSELSERIKHIDTFVIQNGIRSQKHFDLNMEGRTLKINHMFCFGKFDEAIFNKNNYQVKLFSSFGSLVGGLFLESNFRGEKIIYDLCYVSQWQDKDRNYFKSHTLKKCWELDIALQVELEKKLLQYVKNSDTKLAIALRSSDPKELKYFMDFFGSSATYIESDRESFSSYNAMESSKLVISSYSTCAFEMLSYGKKVLFYNGTDNNKIKLPVHSLNYLDSTNPKDFADRIESLIAMNQENYEKIVSDKALHINNYEKNNSTHSKISSYLTEKYAK